MTKKILKFGICFLLVLSLSACSPAEALGEWLGKITAGAGDIIPNDVEALIGGIFGNNENERAHDTILSTGYVNMLKDGTYSIIYKLSDGTEVQAGSNGVHSGSTYPESNVPPEVEYDDDGDPVEQTIPMEHIVLSDGIYYYVDDNAATLYTVNPANYKAIPVEIKTGNIAFAQSGNKDVDGENLYFEEYSTDEGSLIFYYNAATLVRLEVNQGSGYTFTNIVSFNKYLKSTLVVLPSSYAVNYYWTE